MTDVGNARQARGRPINPDGWWYRASDEERLRQIDAGIELGMSARQISLASGARVSPNMQGASSAIGNFGARHGRHFPSRGRSGSKTIRARGRATAARYLRGEPVDFWAYDPLAAKRTQDDEIKEVSFE